MRNAKIIDKNTMGNYIWCCTGATYEDTFEDCDVFYFIGSHDETVQRVREKGYTYFSYGNNNDGYNNYEMIIV